MDRGPLTGDRGRAAYTSDWNLKRSALSLAGSSPIQVKSVWAQGGTAVSEVKYNTVVKEVGAWWHPDRSFYGDAGKFSIEDGVLSEQLERLKRYVETGSPSAQ